MSDKMESEIQNERSADSKAKVDFEFPVWRASRRKIAPDAAFFVPGNVEREILAKQAALEVNDEDNVVMQYEEIWKFPCPIMGCKAQLSALEDFEDHYIARHSATCSVCTKAFPTTRLLDIHVAESHDSFFQAKVARGYNMYVCLVEGCSLKFISDEARRQHLLDRHKFPSSFEFHKRKHFSKKQRQRFQTRVAHEQKVERKLKVSVEQCQGKENVRVDESIDSLTASVSKLSTNDTVPKTVNFGRRHNRAFEFVPRSLGRKRN